MKSKRTQKKQMTPGVYKPKFIVRPTKETLSSDEDQFNFDEEQFSSDDDPLNSIAKRHSHVDQLNSVARGSDFGPKIVYE